MSKNYVVDKKKEVAKQPSSFAKMGKFFKDTKAELKKVTWPSKDKAIKMGMGVIVFTIALACITGVFDFGISNIIKIVTK